MSQLTLFLLKPGEAVEGMPAAAQLYVDIDREKANTFGVAFASINQTISANLGSAYVNDFPNAGRMQRVTVQAEPLADVLPSLAVITAWIVLALALGSLTLRRRTP